MFILTSKLFLFQILNQGSAPMSFLESHIKQFVACKLEPKNPGCELILQAAASIDDITNLENNADNQASSELYSYFNRPYPRRYYV